MRFNRNGGAQQESVEKTRGKRQRKSPPFPLSMLAQPKSRDNNNNHSNNIRQTTNRQTFPIYIFYCAPHVASSKTGDCDNIMLPIGCCAALWVRFFPARPLFPYSWWAAISEEQKKRNCDWKFIGNKLNLSVSFNLSSDTSDDDEDDSHPHSSFAYVYTLFIRIGHHSHISCK